MSKFIRVFSVVLIIIALAINAYSIYASDIDMNLAANTANPTENAVTDNSNTTSQNVDDPQQTPDGTTNDEVAASSVGTISEEGLGLSNVLSILLITVGVVLILLAIAIIIRLK